MSLALDGGQSLFALILLSVKDDSFLPYYGQKMEEGFKMYRICDAGRVYQFCLHMRVGGFVSVS